MQIIKLYKYTYFCLKNTKKPLRKVGKNNKQRRKLNKQIFIDITIYKENMNGKIHVKCVIDLMTPNSTESFGLSVILPL